MKASQFMVDVKGSGNMARFYGSMQGDRKEVTRCGTKNSGIRAHIRGWKIGVSVVGKAVNGDADEFRIYATSGSTPTDPKVYLGTVRRSETDYTIQLYQEK